MESRRVQVPDTVSQLQNALDRMIPSGVGVVARGIADEEKALEYPEERQHLANAVLKRRNEFIAGRHCARAALARIGVDPCSLPPGENRAPQWPEGLIGSISHTIGLCCAIAARQCSIACLGIDLETTTRISPGVIERISHPLEADFVGGDQARGSLIFGAKEAFFKAQFPTWGVWPNFDDLALRTDVSQDCLKVVYVATHLPSDLRENALKMQFRYAFISDYVVVLCWLHAVSNVKLK